MAALLRFFVAASVALCAPVAVAAGGLEVPPGSVLRWPGEEIERCGVGDDSWQPLGGDCWYAFDLLAGERSVELWRATSVGAESVTVRVGPFPYPVQEITVEQKYSHPDPKQVQRIRNEQRLVAALWRSTRPAEFSLPLSEPLDPLPDGRSFGSRRVVNGAARSPHSGVDFSARPGTPVRASAGGTVVLADDLYYSGNSVFIDHGNELVTMYFHLTDIEVEAGQQVARGDVVGTTGATGRVTGPHLHFGVRWHGARIDPELLLSDPETIATASSPRSPPAVQK